MEEVKFTKCSLLGNPWFIEVKRGPIVVGKIQGGPDGPFRYFAGQSNVLNPNFEDSSLDNLKSRIRANPTGETLG